MTAHKGSASSDIFGPMVKLLVELGNGTRAVTPVVTGAVGVAASNAASGSAKRVLSVELGVGTTAAEVAVGNTASGSECSGLGVRVTETPCETPLGPMA
jgi:hypothetical protein